LFSYPKWSETRCSITTAIQRCFRICHQEGAGKPGGTEIEWDTSAFGKEVGLEINSEKAKYMLLSCHQNVSQNRDIKIENRSFESVSQFKYFGTTVTNQNWIQDKIKR
jgi:hypothetical protein